jgi:ABC-type dipeptide/oligopeptide/nickel transport system ATPase subunit
MILGEITFTIGGGDSLALIGVSGSGKTTLAKCLAGLLVPTRGSLRITNAPVRAGNASPVQLLFQNHSASLDPTANAGEAIREGLEAGGGPSDNASVAAAGEAVGLTAEILARVPGKLSGGERQRVAIARTLGARPLVLIADEPTSALDRLTGDRILDVLTETCHERGVSLVVATHDLEVAQRACSHALVIHDGGLVDEGTWESLGRSPRHDVTRALLMNGQLPA